MPVPSTAPGLRGREPLFPGLEETEAEVLAELELVRSALAGAVEVAGSGRRGQAAAVESAHADSRRRHAILHENVVALIERLGPVGGELRLAMALLNVNDRIDRMSAQCVNIVTLRNVLSQGVAPDTSQLVCLQTMAELTDRMIVDAAAVFSEREVSGVTRLREAERRILEQHRRCSSLTLANGGNHREARKADNLAMLMARAIERIGDDAVGIGRGAVFVATGAWADR